MNKTRHIPLLIIATALLAFYNSFDGVFVFDDKNAITNNPYIRQLWPLTDAMSWPQHSTVAARPVVCFSLAVNYAVSGLDPWSYHAFNLFVHIFNALLLYGILRRTLQLSNAPTLHAPRSADWLAAVIALLWVAHPLQTEAVTYVIQRTELLFAFFLLLTLYCLIRGHDSKKRCAWFAAGVAVCAMGMACKEVMVVAPLVVWFYDWMFLSSSVRKTFRTRWKFYAGLAATWLLLALLIAENPRHASAGLFFDDLTPWLYFKTQCGVIIHYLRLAFWPHPLVIDYAGWPLAQSLGDVAVAGILLLTLAVASVWAFVRRNAFGFLGIFFFIVLAPTSSLMPIATEIAAERRMYLPLAAVIAFVVVGGWYLLQRIGSVISIPFRVTKWVSVALCVVVLTALCWKTTSRNEIYKSELEIWKDVVSQYPDNARALHNLAIAMESEGKYALASSHRKRAAELDAEIAAAYLVDNAKDSAAEGKWDKAVRQFEEALRLNPKSANAHSEWGSALMKQGEFAEAMRHFDEALQIDPLSAPAHSKLGVFFARQGKFDAAAEHFRRALQLDRKAAEPRSSFGNVLFQLGRVDEAAQQFREAARLNSEIPEPHLGLAKIAAHAGKTAETLAEYNEALRLRLDTPEALEQRAWILATTDNMSLQNPSVALCLAERACQLTKSSQPLSLDTFAAAYAVNGLFERAIREGEKARQLALEANQTELATEIEKRVVLYRNNTPFRQTMGTATARRADLGWRPIQKF